MEEILKELNTIYQLISSIPVQGDAVDAMAAARAKLREVHGAVKNISKEATPERES